LERKNALSFAITVIIVVAAIGLASYAGQGATSSNTAPTMTVNGSTYYADDVTSVMVAENPGTFHFDNGSVTFLGVTFQTLCTNYGDGCPVPPPPPGTIQIVSSGAGISLNVTFPDHISETISGAFPLVPVYFYTFTHHTNPQAGILIVYTYASPSYKSYLLVSTG
jgi:hypothetical protein